MTDHSKKVEEIRRWHDDLVSRGGCYPCDRGRCPAPSLLAAYDAMKALLEEAVEDFGHESDCYQDGYGCASDRCDKFERKARKALGQR